MTSGLAASVKKLPAGLLKLIPLLLRKSTWLVVLCVKLRPRAMTTTDSPLEVSLPKMCSILVLNLGLRVEAGLLNRMKLGLTVKVCVTVMCRRRLFDSRLGQRLSPLVKLIPASRPPVSVAVLAPESPRIATGFLTIPLNIDRRGKRPKSRNITVALPWTVTTALPETPESKLILRALPPRTLSLGILNRPKAWSKADPFELDGLMTMAALLAPKANETLPRVRKLLQDPRTPPTLTTLLCSP